MSLPALPWIALGLAASGCAAAPHARVAPPAAGDPPPRSDSQRRAPNAERQPGRGEPAVELPAFEVRDSAFSDFGMSVKTNLAVKWGDYVEWMRVVAIDCGSSAEEQKLRPGDRILALDSQPITTIDREAMLAALFHRKAGERLRVLVLAAGQPLPRFVTLTARRPAAGTE